MSETKEPEIWFGTEIKEVVPISDIPYSFPDNWGAKKRLSNV